MTNTVPNSVTKELLEFCRDISPNKPLFIKSKPSADAIESHCFDNVARKIERAGGEIIYGWAIWMLPNVYFEAEHHGAWRNRNNKIFDVSPQPQNALRILFLPDSHATYDPLSYRSNILRAVEENAVAKEIVGLVNARNAIIDRYRNGGSSIASLTRDDQVAQAELKQRISELWSSLS